MGADEVGTLRGLTERRAILDRLIGEHRGRIANTAGDSVLAEFGSAVDAVQCAVDAQAALAEANSSLPSDRRISFRIGVHIGDVMVRAGDLFGDGVNIAARLQALAKPGSVCISGATHEQVRKLLPVTFADLGSQQFKNIQQPIRVYQLAEVREGAPAYLGAGPNFPALPDKPSIAVLPFQNMSGDPEQDYFADGIVEDIITALSRFKSLFVIARNSSFTYKGKAVDIKQVGRELGVRYVLEGSVRKAGGKLRITGQLIEAATGAHLWADRFDGPLDDIFELQDKVTSSAASAIAPQLERAEIVRSLRQRTESLAAIDLHYRAMSALLSHTRQGIEDALRLAQQSIELDPNSASPYGVILSCYGVLREEGWADREQLFAEGKHHALRAVELGADDAFALARAANFFATTAKDTDTGDAIVNRAIALNPNQVEAWRIRGWIGVWAGQHERAIDDFHEAMRLNPLDARREASECGLAAAHFFLGHFEIAVSWVVKSLASRNTYAPALRIGVASYAMLGRIAEAQTMHVRLRETGAPPQTISEIEKWIPYKRRKDFVLFVEAYRIAGVPE